jgi:sulfate permease, SulP family
MRRWPPWRRCSSADLDAGRLLKLGFITDFLSKPILVGYITGTSLIVIGSQLGKMVGIKVESDDFLRQIIELLSRFDEWNMLTFALGVVAMAILVIIRRVNRALPGPLIVVVLGILASVIFDLAAKGVKVVGEVPAGLPTPAIPAVSVQDIFALLPAALALTILIYADEILTARVFATKHGQKIDANQEFIAIGMANIGAGLLQGFPAATSGSRTTVSTRWAANRSGRADRRRADDRLPALFHAVAGAAAHGRVGRDHHYRHPGLDRRTSVPLLAPGASAEAWLAVATMIGVLTVGVLQGILIAVVLSLINVIYHISRPHDALLDDVDAAGGTSIARSPTKSRC